MLSTSIALFIALEHVGFAVLEMVLWTRPTGRRIFRLSEEQARSSAVLAMNQGLYNLFLSAGLIASAWLAEPQAAAFRWFVLACVLVAGIFGGISSSRQILLVQALPAALGLVAQALRL